MEQILIVRYNWTFRFEKNLSSSSSIFAFDPRQPSTTFEAHSKYFWTRSSLHPLGVPTSKSLKSKNTFSVKMLIVGFDQGLP